MIGKVFGIIVTASFFFAILHGNMNEVSAAAAGSAKDAVELAIALAGTMSLWTGTARVLDKCGFTEKLQKLITPILKVIYPESFAKKRGIKEAAASISANFLGLGNAALPLGIEAIKKIEEKSERTGRASDDAVMFAVLATTPFQLLPVTLAAIRQACGSNAPYEILIPVWLCEIATIVFAVNVCKLLSRVFK